MIAKIKSFVHSTSAAQYVLGTAINTLARRRRQQGNLYGALDLHCRACRYMPDSKHTAIHRKTIHQLTRQACYSDGQMTPIAKNEFLRQFQSSAQADQIRGELGKRDFEHRIRLRKPKQNDHPSRQGCLFIWKTPNAATGERGVILLKYLYSFAEFPAMFDMSAIAKDYRIVLEPSWTNYFEAPFFMYIGSELDVIIQCTQPYDAKFFEDLDVGFRTVSMGGGDWVDYDLFKPGSSENRKFDVVMVADWVRWKRHHVLFDALKKLKNERAVRVALIGRGNDQQKQSLENDMRACDVRDQCELFEDIPAHQVAEIVADSKMALLLSKLEGTNKGIHEAMFCNTPIIVYRHHVGLNMDSVNSMTGELADDHELHLVIKKMMDGWQDYRPREWALQNTGYKTSTETINEMLQSMAHHRGEPWTQDLVYKANRPHSQYKFDDDRIRLQSAYDDLARYLIPSASKD